MSEHGQQGAGRVERDDPTRVDDRDPVAETFGLVQVVRRQQDGELAALAQASDHLEQFMPNTRIEADGRFVQEQDLRP